MTFENSAVAFENAVVAFENAAVAFENAAVAFEGPKNIFCKGHPVLTEDPVENVWFMILILLRVQA